MALRADHSTLPTAPAPSEDGDGAPDAILRFAPLLAHKWESEKDDDKPTALGTRFRHSDAGKCARAIGYVAAGVPKSDPMDLTGVWNTSLGTLIHELWQEALAEAYPDAEVETKVGHDDLDGSGHIDAVIRLAGAGEVHSIPDTDADPGGGSYADDLVIAYELKTVGGYAFKASTGKIRKSTPPEGPKPEHVLQAALNGLGVDADEVVVGYLAKETLSKKVGAGLPDERKFCAEWTFPRDVYEPLAIAEKARINGILRLVDKGTLPARKFPAAILSARAEIVNPSTGRWEEHNAAGVLTDSGNWWACDYCSFQTTCSTTERGRVTIASVVSTVADEPDPAATDSEAVAS